MPGVYNDDFAEAERLLHALAHQLKMPLVQIAHQSEIAADDALIQIGTTAERAITLVDNYLLAATLKQQSMEFEPVSVSSVLYDAAEELLPMAGQHGCKLELIIDGKYEPVMANRRGLKAALVSLGQSFIEAETDDNPRVILSGYKSRGGITAGLFGGHDSNTLTVFGRLLASRSISKQSLLAASSGVYVADSLISSMSAQLFVAKHRNLRGLAATFTPSAQLRLV